MELINPTLTIHNTDQAYWLLRMEHRLSEHEHIDVQLRVSRSEQPLSGLQAQLIEQTMALLQQILDARHS